MREEDIVLVKKGHVQLTMTFQDIVDLGNIINEVNPNCMTTNEFNLSELIKKMAQTICQGKVK